MASGGFDLVTTSGTAHLKSKIIWQSISNGSAANSSNVTAAMQMWRDNTGYATYGTGTFSITINGAAKTENKRYSFNESKSIIISNTVTVPHNSDGTKTIKISGSYSGDSPIGGNGEASFALDTIPRKSTINEIGDFNVEGEHWLTFTKNNNAFYQNLWIQARKSGTNSAFETVGTFGGYRSGQHIKFSPKNIAQIYKIAMPNTAPGRHVDVLYHLETFASQGGQYIGEDTRQVKGYINGTIYTNINGTWKACVPFVNDKGTWKPCISYENVNKSWKQTHV